MISPLLKRETTTVVVARVSVVAVGAVAPTDTGTAPTPVAAAPAYTG